MFEFKDIRSSLLLSRNSRTWNFKFQIYAALRASVFACLRTLPPYELASTSTLWMSTKLSSHRESMENSSEDAQTAHIRVANAQIGADSLIPPLSTIQEEDEEVICNGVHLTVADRCPAQIHPSPNEGVVADSDLSRGRNGFESLNRPISFANPESPPGDDSGVVSVIPICA